MPKGIYKAKSAPNGAEYAFVEYNTPSIIGEIPKSQYEARGYDPPFDKLPSKAEYEVRYAKGPRREKRRE